MKRALILVAALLLLTLALLPATLKLDARSDLARFDMPSLAAADRGVVTFALHDWGALNAQTLRTNAMPWKLGVAALALQATGNVGAASEIATADIFRPFGLHVPDTIANWPSGVPRPEPGQPLGLVRAQSAGFTPLTLEIANMGCAACHTSVVYDETGTPDPSTVWLGGTNAALNLSAYTQALFDGFLTHSTDDLMAVAQARFPDMSTREALTLRYAILPALVKELNNRDRDLGALLHFAPSHIGATNGYDSLRLRLGLIDQTTPVTQSYFTSIPALGARTWRSRFLASGVYVPAGDDHETSRSSPVPSQADKDGMAHVVAYFLLPSMGVTAEVAETQHGAAGDVVAWMTTYASQPFPGQIDEPLAMQGRDIYASACAACHGSYDRSLDRPVLSNFPNWEGDIGTHLGPPLDQLESLTRAINGSDYATYLTARPTQARSAPPLAGLWASAPYLANGSVPTLWHLMRPETRPATFPIGGHRLDFARVGIDLNPPSGYTPWSTPGQFDTTREGFSNAGHSIGFDGLSDADKDALLEYLKLL